MATKVSRRKKIKYGIRKKLSGTSETPRLAVFRSNKQIYAQVIDDLSGKTLFSASSVALKSNGLAQAKEVGELIAKEAQSKGVSSVVFDRGGYLYHGRVKALAEGAREGGLKF